MAPYLVLLPVITLMGFVFSSTVKYWSAQKYSAIFYIELFKPYNIYIWMVRLDQSIF